jgi:hypothetical protein
MCMMVLKPCMQSVGGPVRWRWIVGLLSCCMRVCLVTCFDRVVSAVKELCPNHKTTRIWAWPIHVTQSNPYGCICCLGRCRVFCVCRRFHRVLELDHQLTHSVSHWLVLALLIITS